MKVGYLSMDGITCPTNLSGTPLFLSKALGKAYGEVVDLSPMVHDDTTSLGMLRVAPVFFISRLINKFFFKVKADPLFEEKFQRRWACKIEKLIEKHKPDFIYAEKCNVLFRYLNVEIPVFYRIDATVQQFLDFRPYTDKNGKLISFKTALIACELATLQKSTYILPLSNWAMRGVIEEYKISSKKCEISRSHSSLTQEHLGQQKRIHNRKHITFLFIGREWRRKGGDRAVAIAKKLLDRGYEVKLDTICQTMPEHTANLSFIDHHSYIDRSTDEGEEKYRKHFERADFFLLPVHAECLGQVFIDALMQGVPSVACKTGGVEDVVVANQTGLLFSQTDSVDKMADGIEAIIHSDGEYERLSENCLQLYSQEFSYNSWLGKMDKIVKDKI